MSIYTQYREMHCHRRVTDIPDNEWTHLQFYIETYHKGKSVIDGFRCWINYNTNHNIKMYKVLVFHVVERHSPLK